MNHFLKNAGIYILIIGVMFLIIPFFCHIQTNKSLLTGWLLITIGIISYIIINKNIK